jgi:hypothetical protein
MQAVNNQVWYTCMQAKKKCYSVLSDNARHYCTACMRL